MRKKSFIKYIVLGVIIVVAGVGIYLATRPKSELKNVNSESELYSFYYHDNTTSSFFENPLVRLLLLPFSATNLIKTHRYYSNSYDYKTSDIYRVDGELSEISASSTNSSSSSKDFSTTNIQVENVDEADIIKTDGDYMYSISNADVVITDIRNTSEPSVLAHIESNDESIPEDLILSGDTLTVIGTEYVNSSPATRYYSRYYNNQNNTTVSTYNISDRKNPTLIKNYKLYEPYYTSRRIDNKLYVIASGHLRKKSSNEKLVEHNYYENFTNKEFPVNSIRYLDDVLSDNLTLISVLDLNNPDNDIILEPFLLDISNAYVSENAFYLLEENYDKNNHETFWDKIKPLFSLKGVFGFIDEQSQTSNYYYSYSRQTEIYKFNIENSGNISYAAKTKITGETINQYSLDEYNGHLRIALEDNDGSYVAIFNEKLDKIGESGRLGKNEEMYASRFIGDKAYLVTYRNTDPLFVIDLSNESSPKVLGELKIPGYSVDLHPYDDNHLIGIGVDTTEETRKDINGRVISSFTYITGMKLALFDISDFKNPKEISKLHIGDSHTSSAILTNPKALLFSKEKQLLGIPVNNYESEFKIEIDDIDDISSELIDYFSDYEDDYIEEGYLIYNINLENGIEEKGEIVHENSNLIRGAYVENNLITISENTLKINELQNLELKAKLNLTKEE